MIKDSTSRDHRSRNCNTSSWDVHAQKSRWWTMEHEQLRLWPSCRRYSAVGPAPHSD